MKKSKLIPQIFATISATFIFIGTGFHIGWASPSLAKLQATNSDLKVTSDQGSWIANLLLIGTMFGSIVGVISIDKCGRKTVLLVMSVPLFISCLMIAFAKKYWIFYLARFIAGVGNGAIFMGVPMYTSEIAEDRVRGSLGILMTVMINIGSLIPATIGPWASRTTLAEIGAVIPILYGLTFIWVPESPYYYATKGNNNKTKKSLRWLRGTDDISDEFNEIYKNVKISQKNTNVIKELFTTKGNQKALVVTFGLTTCQQFSGCGVILVYSTIILDQVDSGLDSSYLVIILGIISLATAIALIFLADSAGRRPLLLISTSLCVIWLLVEAMYFQLKMNGTDVTSMSWLPGVAMIAFLVSFSIGLGPVPMIMTAELFPCEVKALAMTTGTAYLCIIGACVTKLYQVMTDTYGMPSAFYLFAVSNVLSIIFIYFLVPETKQRSLNDIQNELRGIDNEAIDIENKIVEIKSTC